MTIIVIDTETTHPADTKPFTPRDRIVEFTLGYLDVDPQHWWTQRVNPGIPIHPGSTEVHGITDADVAGLNHFHHVADMVQKALDHADAYAGHHLRYDLPLLHAHLAEHGFRGVDPAKPRYDTLDLFVKFLPRDLTGAVRHYLGREHLGAHGSKADCEAVADVLAAMLERHGNGGSTIPELRYGNGQVRWDGLALLLDPEPGRWMDVARCVYAGPDGILRFGFGKHRGQALRDNPAYLEWMMRARDPPFHADTMAVVRRVWEGL